MHKLQYSIHFNKDCAEIQINKTSEEHKKCSEDHTVEIKNDSAHNAKKRGLEEFLAGTKLNIRYQKGSKKEETPCNLKTCELCRDAKEITAQLNDANKPTGWKERLVLAFSTIEKSDSSRIWLSLSQDIYPFFESHSSILCPDAKSGFYLNWKKKVQDCLSHNKDVFKSGKTLFAKKGYWRLLKPKDLDFREQIPSLSQATVGVLPCSVPNVVPSQGWCPASVHQSTLHSSPPSLPSSIPVRSAFCSSLGSCLSKAHDSFGNLSTLASVSESIAQQVTPADTALSKDFSNFLKRSVANPMIPGAPVGIDVPANDLSESLRQATIST